MILGESDELEKAKQLVEEATKAFDDCIKALEDAKKAKAAAGVERENGGWCRLLILG